MCTKGPTPIGMKGISKTWRWNASTVRRGKSKDKSKKTDEVFVVDEYDRESVKII